MRVPIRQFPLSLFILIGAVFLFSDAALTQSKISITSDKNSADFAKAVSAIKSNIAENANVAARLGGDGPSIYVDLNTAPADVEGYSSFATGDQALITAAIQAYRLHRALGGTAIKLRGLVQRQNNRFYVGLDGRGGRWVTTSQGLVSALLEDFANTAKNQPIVIFNNSSGSAPAANQCPFHVGCLLRSDYTGLPPTLAVIPRGQTVTLDIEATAISADTANGLLLVPQDLLVKDVKSAGAGKLTAVVSVDALAEIGPHPLRIYDPDTSLRSIADFTIQVVANEAELADLVLGSPAGSGPAVSAGNDAFADDHGNDLTTSTNLQNAASGMFEKSGDVDLFRINVAAPGQLTISSSGPTDTFATLLNEKGDKIAESDDGGHRYNFKIDQAVQIGTYFLSIRHCCNGRGPYAVESQLKP